MAKEYKNGNFNKYNNLNRIKYCGISFVAGTCMFIYPDT